MLYLGSGAGKSLFAVVVVLSVSKYGRNGRLVFLRVISFPRFTLLEYIAECLKGDELTNGYKFGPGVFTFNFKAL